jgi:hypothetical protein
MASPGPNARTGQSRDHEGQALLGSQASARQSLTARRSRAVDRSRERHGWSIGVRVRPHRAPCGASLPVGRSVFESGRPETGGYPLTVGVEDLRPAEPRQSLLERRKAERDVHRVRQTPPEHRARRPVDDRHKIEKAAPDRDIGDVGRPDVVCPLDRHVAQEIGIDPVAGRGLARSRLRPERGDPHQAHQPLHALAVHRDAPQRAASPSSGASLRKGQAVNGSSIWRVSVASLSLAGFTGR